jgi:hypothetical protein
MFVWMTNCLTSISARFLQAMLTPERSFFLVVLRHPFAAARHFHGCGENDIKTWIESKELLLEDLKHLKMSAVVHYEHMSEGDTLGTLVLVFIVLADVHMMTCCMFRNLSSLTYAGILNALCKHFNIAPINKDLLNVIDSSKPDGDKRARRAYHGGRKESIVFDKGYTFAWIEKYHREAISKSPDGCQSVFAKYEKAINRFGYSFYNMTTVFASPQIKPWLVPPM